ncbi:MAG: flagellar M-ring protein FliF [Gammaproteobacteria bacterium]|nr:flagellar M-ring protein FliF [Gammaproteobacteria bacterium]
MAEATLHQQATPTPGARNMVMPRINPIDAIAQSRAVRHLARLVGLAAAVAIGTVVVMWSAEPNYAPLYTNMSGQDTMQIADVLVANNIDYKLDANTGTILVDQAKLSEARLKLGAQGLPEGKIPGMEMLQEDQGLGTSQFIEIARYNHALEAELVRSIESIRSVDTARVHLAIPKQSIFIRNRTRPSASVMVKLQSGRVLSRGQVVAITQMVASSVSLMDPSEVAVVDQFGRLLSEDDDAGMAKTSRQFEYTRQLEDNYIDRIIHLLQPIVGAGKVNAQVAAQLNFSAVESTREAFDPERSVIRSEQVSEEEVRNITDALGIPGALSNQPPGAGTTEADATAPVNAADTFGDTIPSNQNRSATRNFEVDRIISHTSNPVGSIQRLSVAVVIDNKTTVADNGNVSRNPYSDEEIVRFVNLIKETIGFDENRGDSVSVVNTPFLDIPPVVIEEVPEWKKLMNETWLVSLVKQVLGALGVLILYFIFGRPFLRSLNPNRVESTEAQAALGFDATMAGATQGGQPPMSTEQAWAFGQPNAGIPTLADDPNNQAAVMRRKDASYDQKIEMARGIVVEDPARVANVIKHWVGGE